MIHINKFSLLFLVILAPIFSFGQTHEENYVLATEYKISTVDENVPEQDRIETITYFDGIGRPKQNIQIRVGPNQEDLVTPELYDNFGRQPLEYLSLPVVSNNGAYYEPAAGSIVSELGTYYNAKFPNDFFQDISNDGPDLDNPYTETRYESPTTDRIIELAAPGYDWRIHSGDTHTYKFEFETNTTSDAVKKFTIIFPSGGNTALPDLSFDGVYPQKQLYKSIKKNENWESGNDQTTQEFRNKEGQLILSRTFSGSETLDTYYAYDDFGNPTFILSPEGSSQITDGSGLVTNYQDILNDLCYQYKYSARRLLIEKKVPGKGWEYIVYNPADKPVLTQDAKLRELNQWSFIKYDVFDRIAYTGIVTTSATRAVLQTQAYNLILHPTQFVSITGANTVAGTTLFYSNDTFPSGTITEIHAINYYDNYIDHNGIALPNSTFGVSRTLNVKGLPTVSKLRVLGENQWITTVSTYDDKGRTIWSCSDNDFLGTTTKVSNKLDFSGKTLETITEQEKDGNDPIIISDYYYYDYVGRLLSHKQKIDDEPIQLIAENVYDELGQLTRKNVGGETFLDGYTDIVNADVEIDGTIAKDVSINSNAWDAGLKTIGEIVDDGGIRFTTPFDAHRYYRVGLVKNATYGDFWSDFDYGIYILAHDETGDGIRDVKLIIDNVVGNVETNYVVGDEFSVERIGSQIIFKKNGSNIIDPISVTNQFTLIGKVSLYTFNAQVQDVELFGSNIDKILQNVDYKYNVRGWLTEINDVNSSNDSKSFDLFNFKINYNQVEGTFPNNEVKPLFSGNIAQTIWKTRNTDIEKRSYGYSYDALSRTIGAYSRKGLTLDQSDFYDVLNLSYDKNGNILTLDRYGEDNGVGTQWDALTYTYSGNSLDAINDLGNALGFNDGGTTNQDYQYDGNGNISYDDNKNITSVTYNHLNLPTEIVINQQGINKYVRFDYDANGVKLRKQVVNGSTTNSTLYDNNFIYHDDELRFINHPEGYTIPVAGTSSSVKGHKGGVTTYFGFNYVFQYKDIWGNVRLSYSDIDKNGSVNASEIIEESNYYPFGLKQTGYNYFVNPTGSSLAQTWKYQGQEFNADFDLNTYEFKYRMHDPAIGKFMQIDPLAEDYVYNSTYAFQENKLGLGVELEGKEIQIFYPSLIADAVQDENSFGAHYVGFGLGIGNSIDAFEYLANNPGAALIAISDLGSPVITADGTLAKARFAEALYNDGKALISGNGFERGEVVGRYSFEALLGKGTGKVIGGFGKFAKAGIFKRLDGRGSPDVDIRSDFSKIGSTGAVGENYLKRFGGSSQESFHTTQGLRYVDQLADGVAYESKVGYTSHTKFIKRQIAKDVELINTGQVNSVKWIFFESPVTGKAGASAPLLNALKAAGIETQIIRNIK